MSGALSQALEAVGRDLERGILDAERELADFREHCRVLETEVRALRAAVRPMPPALTALLSAPDTRQPDEAPASKDQPGSVYLTGPAQDPDMIVLPARPVEASHPHVAPNAAESHPGAEETSTDYMPMLEELWGIARREAAS